MIGGASVMCQPGEPASLIPNVVPLRDMDVTMLESLTCSAHSVSALAAPIASVKKNR